MSDNADSSGSNVRFKDELGVHHTRDGVQSSSVTNQYEFQVEAETVFKRLAEDIYQGPEAGIREPLTNAITAIIRASEEGYLDDPDEGIILFELYDYENLQRLKLRDNGVGLTRDEINEVVSVIGKSTSRSAVDLTGQFGMGFLATWMLAGGVDGGFVMHTNPRGVDEGPISGVWDSNSFSELDDDALDDGLEYDEYGTEFDIMLGQNIETNDVVNWIHKYSEWSRVPVLFRHYTEDGLTDEEFTPKKITDKYESIESGASPSEFESTVGYRNSNLNYYTLETDYFCAVNSNLRSTGHHSDMSKVILLDVPIDHRNWYINRHFPLETLEIRFHYETPIVVEGPHEGKFVASDTEANNLGDEFISENLLTTDDIVTPHPTGTRDVLQDTSGFVEWLGEQFYELYYDDIANQLREVNTLDEYCALTSEERDTFHELINELNDNYRLDSQAVAQIESRARTSFGSALRNALPLLHRRSVSVAPEGNTGVSKKQNRESKSVREIIVETHGTDREVYMGHRITQERAEFVWEADGDHYVVQVNSQDQQPFEDYLEWNDLSDLDLETDLSMDDKTRRKFTVNETPPSEKSVTLHIGSYSNTESLKANTLREKLENEEPLVGSDDTTYHLQKVIAFKRGGFNISDNEHMVGDVVATTSLPNDVYEYLIDSNNVWAASDALERDIIIPASNGNEYDLEDGLEDHIITHQVDEETIKTFRDPEVMSAIQDWLRSNDSNAPSNAVYLPLTPFEKQFAGLERHWRDWSIETQFKSSNYHTVNVLSDVQLYATAVLDTSNPAVNALTTVTKPWDDGGAELVELVEKTI